MPAGRRVFACAFACALAGVAVLAGCTNTKSAINREPHTGTATASPVNGVQQVTITAGDDYRFHPSTIVVHPGRIRIVLVHPGTGGPHDWSLTGFPADFVPLTQAGQTSSASFMAPSPGKYRFVCTIHARQGQTGTLVVKP
jgi:plastocyanin